LGSDHVFSKKMESVLNDSTIKIKGIIERQNKRIGTKHLDMNSKTTPRQDTTELERIIENTVETGHGTVERT
jgi:hypothetical protein